MTSPWEENQILHDIMDGLGVAIHDLEVDPDDLNSIKLNKVIYLAVTDFDLPITYSWYIFGASLSGGQNDVQVEAVEPTALDNLPSPEEPSIGPAWDYPSPEEYAYYFKEDIDLQSIFREENKSYLREFYSGYAPEEYEDLYISSAILQKSLDKIRDMGLDEFNANSCELLDSVQQEIRSLNHEILLNNNIEDSEENAITSYTDILMRVIHSIKESDDDLSPNQFQKLKRMIKFFYSHAWKYVALSISEQTATGPSRRDLIRGTVNEFNSLEKNYPDELNALKESCKNANLLPEFPEVSVDMDLDPSVEPDAESVEAAFGNIQSQMAARDYDSMNPEEFTK